MRSQLSLEAVLLLAAVALAVCSLGVSSTPGLSTVSTEAQQLSACPPWLFWVQTPWPMPPRVGISCRWDRSIVDREGYIGPVKTGVTLGPIDVSGWERPQVEALLDRLAESFSYEPVAARHDPVHNKVVPALNGIRLNRAETLNALFSAPPDCTVSPRLEQIPPSVTIEAFPESIVYHGHPRKQQVTITINVAWNGRHLQYLRDMLDILDAAGAQTTFFLAGQWVEQNPTLAQELASLGHELANHGYTDAHPAQLSTGKLQAELRKTAKVIKDCCGQTPKYYSPFYGEYARQVVKTAAAMDYTVVRWSIDTVDWTLPGAELMVEATAHKLHPGAIILMHPTEQSAQALRGIMALLEKRGLELVPLSELLPPTWRPAIKPDAGY